MARSVLSRSTFADGNVRDELSLGVTAELEHTSRLTAYREYWNFYKGKHWTYARDENEPLVTANFARRFVTVSSGWLFKKGFEVNIPDDPKTEKVDTDEREFIAKALNKVWEQNGPLPWGIEAGQMGSVTGDLFIRPSWEKDDELEDPYVRMDIIPSHFVFPEFGGPEGMDRKKMTQCLIIYPRYEYKRGRWGKVRSRVRMDGEVWYPNKREIIKDDKIIQTVPNPFGEIPIVHIPNMLLAGEFYGVSDLADLLELQKMYNEKMTDISDVIDYHASPVTVVKGQSVKQLERGANQMWGIKKDADIFNLELKGDLSASTGFLDRVERLMSILSGVPSEALGDIQDAANTSGVALALRFLPLTDIRDLKMATYGLGLRRANRLAIKILELKDEEFGKEFRKLKKKYPKSNLYRNEVTFNSPMPRDELIELQKTKEKLELGLSTPELEMEAMGYDKDKIKKVVDATKKELEEAAFAEFGAEPPKPERDQKEEPANPEGGNPPHTPGQQEKQSITKGQKQPKTT